MSLGGSAMSDAAGRFAIEAIAPGTYQVIAEPRLSAVSDANPVDVLASLKMQSVEIREGETTHVVLGAPPRAPVRLHGLVTRSSEPVRRGMVMAILEGAPVLSSMKMAAIGADGRYEVTLDEPGDYTLVVGDRMGDADGVEFHETIPAREEHRLDLELPNGRVRGRVLASDGGPLEAIEVGIEREGEVSLFSIAEGHTQRTDSEGRFEFGSLAPGSYRLRAPRSRGAFFGGEERRWGIAVRTGLALDAGATIDGVELVLSAPGSIAGVVRDSEGKPAPRATIFVRADSGEVLNPVSGCTSDATGRFEFGGASAGTYTVSARAGALASRESGPVRVVEGQSSEVELRLEPGTVLRVTIEDEAGARVRAAVRVLDENGRDVGRLHGLDALEKMLSDGLSSTEQRFGPLPAGKYRVIATGPAGDSVNKPVTLTGQEERSLRIKLKD
jgi:hypothetical protein